MNICQTKLALQQVSHSFGEKKVLDRISLQVGEGEIVSLLGGSGVGKTTLFHCIAGLLTPDSGEILLDGKPLQTGQVGYMLQKDLLMPHKTLLENLALPLLLKKVSKKTAFDQVSAQLSTFGLEGYGHFYPSALSGGMKQRAALLRTYLSSHSLFLLDEPFSALDSLTKSELHQWYLEKMNNISTLFITHDMDEALTLSQRIYLLAGQPANIVAHWTLPPKKDPDFPLTPEFLTYKKEIIQSLKQNSTR